MTETRVLLTGLAFPESPRWRDGRVHVSDWGAGEVHAVAADGSDEIVAKGTAFPMCIDFLPDGRLLVVHGPDLLVRDADGTLAPYADLAPLAEHAYNEIAVDPRGATCSSTTSASTSGRRVPAWLDPACSRPVPTGRGRSPTGSAFPNGMAARGDTLIVAESYAVAG